MKLQLFVMSFFFYSQLICTGFVSFQKLHGNKHKNNCQHSRKSKSHKRRRRDCPSSLSLTESYSPTIPTSRRDDDSQSNTLGTSIESQKSPEREQESFFQDQEPDLSHSPTIYTQSRWGNLGCSGISEGCSTPNKRKRRSSPGFCRPGWIAGFISV